MDWSKIVEQLVANGLGIPVAIGGFILLYKVIAKKEGNKSNNECEERIEAMEKKLDLMQIEQSHISANIKEANRIQHETVSQLSILTNSVNTLAQLVMVNK